MAVLQSVRVGYTASPAYPGRLVYKELEFSGPAEYDVSVLDSLIYPQQRHGSVSGQVIYDYLKNTDMLKSCVGLLDLEAIRDCGLFFFRRNFNGKALFGWKSVVEDENGSLLVPYVSFDAELKRVVLRWRLITDQWFRNDAALRFFK